MPHILVLATFVPCGAGVPSPTTEFICGRDGLSHFEREALMLTVYLPHASCQP